MDPPSTVLRSIFPLGVACLVVLLGVRGATGQSQDIVLPDAGTQEERAGADAGTDVHDAGSTIEIVRLNESLPNMPREHEVDLGPPDRRPEILRTLAQRAIHCIARTQSPKRSDVGFEFDLPAGSLKPRLTEVIGSAQLHVSLDEIQILRLLGPVDTNVSIGAEDRWFRRCVRGVRLPYAPSEPLVLSFRVKWRVDGWEVYDVTFHTERKSPRD